MTDSTRLGGTAAAIVASIDRHYRYGAAALSAAQLAAHRARLTCLTCDQAAERDRELRAIVGAPAR